ncbi:hypothetical protein [Amycolatopsis cihanbeyliensis]|uniref:Uncharacterized protein n=1 Tax=Amycolatopsis cihanbeyliensis TaxID=1128664 RepID=A0A542DEB8_AMYCI|nr:hypothetical protein [Amycolatopsis cihanbeyliensis]TQJ01386.1 hypothetical protein FB471_1064 [Amycolatopsis cihanbeyliensis]
MTSDSGLTVADALTLLDSPPDRSLVPNLPRWEAIPLGTACGEVCQEQPRSRPHLAGWRRVVLDDHGHVEKQLYCTVHAEQADRLCPPSS